jgi:hypothetical protein
MAIPNKSTRPRAFERDSERYQWRLGRAPSTIIYGDQEIENPFKKTAVFVVHGIGDQKDTDTAVTMRWGIEDSVPLLELGNWDTSGKNQWILPAPYVNDGHWAQYDDLTIFSDDIGEDLNVLTNRQLQFFSNAWRSRTVGWFRSWWWIVRQGLKLVVRGPLLKAPFFLLLTVLVGVIMFVAGAWPKSRKFVVTYVNDARLYVEPKGDIEHEIVQLIDRRVARGFLKTIGLDMEFNELPAHKSILLGGKPHCFDRVIWTAHSLGTVISFNVIGDLLEMCKKVREEANKQDIYASCPKAERVENSISKFVTFGSPIDKVCFLYGFEEYVTNSKGGKTKIWSNQVLRKWPEMYLPGGRLDITKNCNGDVWWSNVFYGSDPISGPLNTIEKFLFPEVSGTNRKGPFIQNVSTLGFRWPLAAHTSYWRDSGVVTTVLSASYAGYAKKVVHKFFLRAKSSKTQYFSRCWPNWKWLHGFLSSVGLVVITGLLTYLIIWSVLNWQQVAQWYKSIKAILGGG